VASFRFAIKEATRRSINSLERWELTTYRGEKQTRVEVEKKEKIQKGFNSLRHSQAENTKVAGRISGSKNYLERTLTDEGTDTGNKKLHWGKITFISCSGNRGKPPNSYGKIASV